LRYRDSKISQIWLKMPIEAPKKGEENMPYSMKKQDTQKV